MGIGKGVGLKIGFVGDVLLGIRNWTHTQGRRHGGQGVTAPLKVSKKEKKIKYGVFSCIKISFSVIFDKEIHALRRLLSRF